VEQNDISADYIKLLPIFGGAFRSAPLLFPLCEGSAYYGIFADMPQTVIQSSLEGLLAREKAEWSVSGYLENRAAILKNYPQMAAEKRFYHLGIDVGAPCGTRLYAPLDCEAVVSGYEEGQGNYGGYTVLKCRSESDNAFYMLFGHLDPEGLPPAGAKLKKGDAFARLGGMDQNGGWFYHTHLQILTQLAFEEGWVSKGYCRESELEGIAKYCPDPLALL